eukprot:4049968-Pyramimonas_sp.AAC.1
MSSGPGTAGAPDHQWSIVTSVTLHSLLRSRFLAMVPRRPRGALTISWSTSCRRGGPFGRIHRRRGRT